MKRKKMIHVMLCSKKLSVILVCNYKEDEGELTSVPKTIIR